MCFSSSAGSVVGAVRATHNGGSSGKITYSFLSGNEHGAFNINPNTGTLINGLHIEPKLPVFNKTEHKEMCVGELC